MLLFIFISVTSIVAGTVVVVVLLEDELDVTPDDFEDEELDVALDDFNDDEPDELLLLEYGQTPFVCK